MVMEQCRECEVKDAEISRKIQILGDVLQMQLNSSQQLQHPGGGSIEMSGTATEGAPIVTYPVVSHFVIPFMCTPPASLSTSPPAGAQIATSTASDSMLQVQKTPQVDYCAKEEPTYHGNKVSVTQNTHHHSKHHTHTHTCTANSCSSSVVEGVQQPTVQHCGAHGWFRCLCFTSNSGTSSCQVQHRDTVGQEANGDGVGPRDPGLLLSLSQTRQQLPTARPAHYQNH